MEHTLTTKNGYDLFEVSSAFQKAIRRGIEKEALYWGLELFESNYYKYAWKRLLIMSAEDIGLANPELIVQVKSLLDTSEMIQKVDKDKTPSVLHFILSVLLCVRSPKSRIVDNALNYIMKIRHNGERLEIPDYCLDKHTRRGKMLGRTWKDFHFTGAHLENLAGVEGAKSADIDHLIPVQSDHLLSGAN